MSSVDVENASPRGRFRGPLLIWPLASAAAHDVVGTATYELLERCGYEFAAPSVSSCSRTRQGASAATQNKRR